MSTEPKEPSQWAVEACDKLRFVAYNFSCVGLPVIQHAINQACAERDAEIAELCESCQEQTAISDGFAESIRAKDVELVARRKRIESLEQAENEWWDALTNRDAEIVKLQGWKTSALKVMPEFQTIGALLGVPLGEDVSSNIIPGITKLKEEIARLKEDDSELRLVIHEQVEDLEELRAVRDKLFAEGSALQEQNRSLRALLERVPHENFWAESAQRKICHPNCLRCAYEQIIREAKAQA